MVRFENITAQISGGDTFTTQFAYQPGSLSLGYNGQLYPKGENIALEIPPFGFKLTFTPAPDTTALLVIYQDGFTIDEDIVASSQPPRSTI